MAFDKDKYTRVSVDLVEQEYAALHRATEERGATKAAYVRAAVREKIEKDEHTKRLVESAAGNRRLLKVK